MGAYVDTDLQSLIELKNSLINFQEKTEMMRMFTRAGLDEFEQEICSRRRSDDVQESAEDDFGQLWNRYLNCRECFESQIDRLLQNEIVCTAGGRNLYTMISALEEYLKMS